MLYGWLDPRPAQLGLNWPQTVHMYNNGALVERSHLRRRAAAYIGSGLADGTLAPVIAETFEGLDRVADAHRLMESNAHTGKILVALEGGGGGRT